VCSSDLYRLWSADPKGGWVKFYFDGEEQPRLEFQPFSDMFTDKVYPFVPPVSQNILGGWCSFVPIPFEKSLKIVAGGPVEFLQITWHKFPSADGVKTFDPNYSQENRQKLVQVRKAFRSLGQPPSPLPATAKEKSGTITIASGKTGDIIKLGGTGVIRAIHLKPECADTKFGRKALLMMNVDGQKDPNIYSPINDFFLDPFGGEKCQSLLIGKDNDTYYSYWVMPYASGAAIKLQNDSPSPVKLTYDIVYEPMKKLPDGMGRFFAWWHRQFPTVEGQPFTMLEATGKGQFCGVSHAMQDERVGIGYLEGDEMMWIDDRDNTTYNGTGTEDYFCGGWYFGDKPIDSTPFYGCGVRTDWGRCHAYRLQITDLVPFQQKAKIVIEHGPMNNWNSDYAGVTYWYAAPGTTHSFKPVGMPDRLIRRWPKPETTEAESLFDPKSGGRIATDYNEGFCLSSGKGVSTAHGKIGESFSMLADMPDSGVYYIYTDIIKGPAMGIAQVAVDGQPVGQKVDAYAKRADQGDTILAPILVGGTQTLAKGQHKITVTATGKNDASASARVLLDSLVVRPELFYEAEGMQVTGIKGGSQSIITRGPEVSNSQILNFVPDGPGATMTLHVPALTSGTYRMTVRLRKDWNAGNAKFAVDGRPNGPEYEGYDEWGRAFDVTLGPMDLTAGDHRLTVEATGKDPKSKGTVIGIDTVWLSVPR
jgi:hypothetical protein